MKNKFQNIPSQFRSLNYSSAPKKHMSMKSKNLILKNDFKSADANVVIKEFIVHDQTENKEILKKPNNIIKNPESQTKNDFVKPKKDVLISGSNYQNIIPNVGVRILEENKSKTGGLDFKNQFGRMSMKEYELLRKKYSNYNETNFNSNYIQNNNNENNYHYNEYTSNELKENPIKRTHTYDLTSDNNKTNQDLISKPDDILSSNNLYYPMNDNHMHNMGLKHYDWSENEDTTSHNLINNGNRILNENLFKKKYIKRHSVYSDKNLKFNVNMKNKEMNYFNNQIMQSKNWGNDNEGNMYRNNRKSFTFSMKKSEGNNLRIRKKI